MGGNKQFIQTSRNTGITYYEGRKDSTTQYMVRGGGNRIVPTNIGRWRTQKQKDKVRASMGKRSKRTSKTEKNKYTF